MSRVTRAIKPGSYVYGNVGVYVGQIEAATEGAIRVRGPLPDEALYVIPVEAIAGEMGGGHEVFLDCSLEDLREKGWLIRVQQAPIWAILPGGHVYDAGGGYVGEVEAANNDIVRIRGPQPEELVYYVPIEAISGEIAGGRELFLNCAAEELRAKNWLHPPHGYESVTAG